MVYKIEIDKTTSMAGFSFSNSTDYNFLKNIDAKDEDVVEVESKIGRRIMFFTDEIKAVNTFIAIYERAKYYANLRNEKSGGKAYSEVWKYELNRHNIKNDMDRKIGDFRIKLHDSSGMQVDIMYVTLYLMPIQIDNSTTYNKGKIQYHELSIDEIDEWLFNPKDFLSANRYFTHCNGSLFSCNTHTTEYYKEIHDTINANETDDILYSFDVEKFANRLEVRVTPYERNEDGSFKSMNHTFDTIELSSPQLILEGTDKFLKEFGYCEEEKIDVIPLKFKLLEILLKNSKANYKPAYEFVERLTKENFI